MNFEEYAEGYERAVAAIAHADLSGAERAALISQFYKLAFAMRNADDATRVLVEATIADVAMVTRMGKRRVVVCNVQP